MSLINNILTYCLLLLIVVSCKEDATYANSDYKYFVPSYDQVKIVPLKDTLHFMLNENTYNDIESMNMFEQNEREYISFFDKRSASLTFYKASSGEIIKQILLKKLFKKSVSEKVTVYVSNFDSLFVTDRKRLYLFDTSGRLKKVLNFQEEPITAKTLFENANPPISQGSKLFTSVKASGTITTLKKSSQWKVIYEFDLNTGSSKLHYPLPEIYQRHLYGYQFLHHSYCFNNNNHFVFSFAADSVIYETDLNDYHVSYYAKSRYQDQNIKWLPGNASFTETGYKNYLTNHAYDAIYYDQHSHRYLRVTKHKISDDDFAEKKMNREQSIIILDENFKIVGETMLNRDIDLRTLFFTSDGRLYARIRPKDEYALHFVQLGYIDSTYKQTRLTIK